METPVTSRLWAELGRSSEQLRLATLRTLCEVPGSADELHVALEGLLFDFSRQFLDANMLRQFAAVCDASNFAERREAMWRGDVVNVT